VEDVLKMPATVDRNPFPFTFPLELLESVESRPLLAGEAGTELSGEIIPSMFSVMSWDPEDSVGLIRLLRLPLKSFLFSVTFMPNY